MTLIKDSLISITDKKPVSTETNFDKKVIECVILSEKKSNANPSLEYASKTISVLAPLLVLVFGIYKYFSDKREQRTKDERQYASIKASLLEKKLEEFYLPFLQLRAQSSTLYSVFANNLKEIEKEKGFSFKTLEYLCEGLPLEQSDKEILNEIKNVSQKILALIENKSYHIDEKDVSGLMGKVSSHIRLLILASESKLIGKQRHINGLVFPLETDGAIYSNLLRIEDKIKDLTNAGNRSTPIKNNTINYYNENAVSYAKSSDNISMDHAYAPFLAQLRKYGKQYGFLLDAGCGSGRDTKYFIKQGLKVISFDASEKLVDICNSYPFSYCKHDTFASFKSNVVFDGIWANASLLHLDRDNFESALRNLVSMLSPATYSSDNTTLRSSGIIYFSMKCNITKDSRDKRAFFEYDQKYIESFLEDELKLVKVCDTWRNEGGRSGFPSTFLNFLYQKS